MAALRDKHPSWFKLKTERRQLIKELPPETAVTVLLACLDYLEIGSFPDSMHPIERIAASAFLPDLEEAWAKYTKRVSNGSKGGAPNLRQKSSPLLMGTAPAASTTSSTMNFSKAARHPSTATQQSRKALPTFGTAESRKPWPATRSRDV